MGVTDPPWEFINANKVWNVGHGIVSSCYDNVIKRFLWIHFVFDTIFGSNGKLFGVLVVLNIPNYFVVGYPILKTSKGIPSTYVDKTYTTDMV